MNSPFDDAKYQALLKGLEATELKLSEVLDENEKFRIDSQYFLRAAVEAEQKVENLTCGFTTFGEATSCFRKGIFDIKAATYTESGVPFVRISNLRFGIIDDTEIAHIPEDIHKSESKTALSYGDMVLSKTAYGAAVFVNLERCNVSQDTIAVRLKPEWKAKLSTAYVSAFLNSSLGLTLMNRQFQGNVQMHLSLSDGEKIKIPMFSQNFQQAIENCFVGSFQQAQNAQELYAQAETLLLEALALNDWQPPQPLTYESASSAAFVAGRLDAEHFQPKYAALLEHLQTHAPRVRVVQEFAARCDRGEQPKYFEDGTLAVVNSRHILENGLDYNNFERTDSSFWNNSRFHSARIQKHDILTYTTGAKIGRTAVYFGDERALASNHVNLLRLREENPVYVAVALNSMIGRMQTRSNCTGSAQVEIYPSDIKSFVVPFVDEATERAIVGAAEDSHTARHRAKELLEASKRAVEIAIERDEAAALAELETLGN